MHAVILTHHAGAINALVGEDTAVGLRAWEVAPPVETFPSLGGVLPWRRGDASAPVVLVLAGHAGAGASAVALAVAEGLADGRRVQLVEYAEPARSGLVAASSMELGAEGAWRQGRRGRLEILRLARRPADGEWPRPPEAGGGGRLLVVDIGWSLTAALLDAPPERPFGPGEQVVVVTRLTVPAVRQTERVLGSVGGEAVVAAVGPARWPRAVEASCGPNLQELRSRGRVIRVPLDRRLETAGLSSDRLPRPVAAAGASLASLLAPGGPPRRSRPAAHPRTNSPRAPR